MIILNENSPGKVLDDNSLRSLQTVLNRYCLSLTQSTWDAEDLAQDTWVKAWGALKVSDPVNPEALLLHIAKNTWIDRVRRKSRYYKVLERVKSKESIDSDNSPLEIEIVMQALFKHMSPLQRTVFLMRDVLGYSAIETAEELETTEGAVKAALFRARHAMQSVRESLSADGPAISENEGYRSFLRTLATSYENGEIIKLLELSFHNEQRNLNPPVMRMGA